MKVQKRGVIKYGPISLNIDRCNIECGEEEIKLSPIGTKLLAILMERAPRVTPPELLYWLLWSDGGGSWPLLTDAMTRLGCRLHESGSGCEIVNVAPFGHRLELSGRGPRAMKEDLA